MTRIARITATALAALALATPVATAMPMGDAPYRDSERRANDSFVATPAGPGASIRPQTGAVVSPQAGVPDTCAPGSRTVHGPAGTGCTTSPPDNAAEYGVIALVIGGAAAFAIALGARPGAGRGRGRASTETAFSGRAS
jgi:hypothetical protein